MGIVHQCFEGCGMGDGLSVGIRARKAAIPKRTESLRIYKLRPDSIWQSSAAEGELCTSEIRKLRRVRADVCFTRLDRAHIPRCNDDLGGGALVLTELAPQGFSLGQL